MQITTKANKYLQLHVEVEESKVVMIMATNSQQLTLKLDKEDLTKVIDVLQSLNNNL